MRSSDQIDQLAGALAKAQATFDVAKKEHNAEVKMREGGAYRYSYADLPIVVAACRKALTDNGIAVIQSASAADRLVSVCTRLVHASGQWISDEDAPLTMTARDSSPQAIGSAVTYARRYALMSMAGVVAADEDDDGAEASRDWTPPQQRQATTAPPRQAQQPRPAQPAATREQLEAEIGLAKTVEDVKRLGVSIPKGHPLRGKLEARYKELANQQKGAA